MELIETKRQAAEYLDIPEDEIFDFYKFQNGDWKYRDRIEYGHDHLYRFMGTKWVELTEDLYAIWAFSYYNGKWEYQDEYGYYHLFNKNNELIEINNYWLCKK